MGWPDVLLAVFVILHGAGHLIWFLGTWFPNANVMTDEAETGAAPRAFGLLSLVLVVAFAVAGYGIVVDADWWRPLVALSSVVSFAVVAALRRGSPGTTPLNAALADAGLLVLATL